MRNASILKRFMKGAAEPYAFPDAAELRIEEAENRADEPESARIPDTPVPDPRTPIDFAKLEAEMILRDARKQAEELLEQVREDAKRESESYFQQARAEGEAAGYADGQAKAAQEGEEYRAAQAAQLAGEVQQFLDRASASLDGLMDQSVNDLRDLAITVAEKIVRISLKSSGEVIGRMILSAIDKRKRREWVQIYIADCDAKRMTQVPRQLTAALSALSGRVRIIPMADDESGTCIIEMPDEIIDASASTQMNNIKNLLTDTPPGDDDGDFRLTF